MNQGIALIIIVIICVLLFIKVFKTSKRNEQIEKEFGSQKEKYITEIEDLKRQREQAENERNKYATQNKTLVEENSQLAKWRVVVDADAKAQEIYKEALAVKEKAEAEASAILSSAHERADALLTEAGKMAAQTSDAAKQEAKMLRDNAKTILDEATLQANSIIESANKKAEEIAGSAYAAMKNAEHYEKAVKAMRNIINGYGDQYLIPGRSLLDELAAEFGYTEAGEELKKARERSRLMVRNDTAATCDYVEENRRETAIRFVLDAFNGKVDSILSRVKNDNAGKLEQELRDAFTIVNHNGMAFRNARINEEYLDARIEELKWAAMAQQLRLEEREEQRRIKEQIREEEKARREYERALRETAREEEVLRKAMEKAQGQIERATAEQKIKYEQQLEELTEKLRLAEERNQRAQSMAQQTKRGHVYVISNIGAFGEHVYKIGLTRRLEPLDRIRELGDSSVPFDFDVHALIFSEDAPALERQLHKHFIINQMNKVNYRKEFFKVELKQIREEIEKLDLGTTAKWTMTAKAQEYYETLTIEKAISSDQGQLEAWINRQLVLDPLDSVQPETLDSMIAETVS